MTFIECIHPEAAWINSSAEFERDPSSSIRRWVALINNGFYLQPDSTYQVHKHTAELRHPRLYRRRRIRHAPSSDAAR